MRAVLFPLLLTFTVSFPAKANLVRNGDFSDSLRGWADLMVLGSARASVTVAQGICRVRVDTTGDLDWSIQLRQSGVRLVAGGVYRYSFDARASAPCVINSAVGRDGGDYAFYSGPDASVRLGTEWVRHETSFEMPPLGDSSARVQFNLGLARAVVEIDNVQLLTVQEPFLFLLSPGGGELVPGGCSYDITWIGRGLDTIFLEYSLNGGLSWIPVERRPAAIGRHAWTTPGSFVPWTLLRIRDATGTLADTSGFFEISAAANLITNGSFADAMTGWSLAVFGGTATAHADSGRLAIRIAQAADLSWKIQLTQPGIELVKGDRYVFSFVAWADAPRPIDAGLAMNGGAYTSYVDTTKRRVALTTAPIIHRMEFTMQESTDTAARVEFNLAGSDADVYLRGVRLERRVVLPAFRGYRARKTTFAAKSVRLVLPRKAALPSGAGLFDIRGRHVGNGGPARGVFVCIPIPPGVREERR